MLVLIIGSVLSEPDDASLVGDVWTVFLFKKTKENISDALSKKGQDKSWPFLLL